MLHKLFFLARITNLQLSAVEAAEEESSLLSPNQMAGYVTTAIFVVIGLCVSYIIIKRFLFKPVLKLMNQRAEAVTEELDAAASKTAQADSLLKDSERRVNEAKSEASDIISEARVQAEKQAKSILDSAANESNEIRVKAEQETRHMHDEMLDQMRDEVTDLAVAIATKVVGGIIDGKRCKELSDKILDETLKSEVNPLG